jgi:hypothetical protein
VVNTFKGHSNVQQQIARPAIVAKPVLSKASLIQFYETHEPTKVAAVDSLLANFDHGELLGALEQKYGAIPELGDPSAAAKPVLSKASLIQFYETHEPTKIASVDEFLTTFDHEELIGALEQKYGAKPELERPAKDEVNIFLASSKE